ncbi:aminotransferase class V-fold PLP-dependent enzyme [Candidatus Saccharibacteria bacterium]|nr:aminotransferase class V-fold PLP-dependent enzyme [Candidatus Saccharibacteria bacterium]
MLLKKIRPTGRFFVYNGSMEDFDYLGEGEVYLDGACQSLRPRPVIDAINKYYTEHNSCGERVKYKWGRVTDEEVEATREKVLKFLKLKPKKYTCSFTLNTTYGINLILSQIDVDRVDKVMTSEIEHNSPFLATMAFSERTGKPREVMKRNEDGSIPIEDYDFTRAVVVVNCASNFDGRKLGNIEELTKAVHKAGGIIIIDAAQAMAHSADVLRGVEVDAICFSAHKLYAPSLGVIVWRDELNDYLLPRWLGGGMVDDVKQDSYILSAENKEHRYTRFESGLQAWGEIVGLGAAIDWLSNLPKRDWQNLESNARELYEFLKSSGKAHLVNHEANPTMTFYVNGLDSHLLGEALSRENIMARTGYFCVHYYLDHVLGLPPLVRFSLGLHNRPEDIEKVKKVLGKVIN